MAKPLKTIVIGTSLTEASDGVVRTGVAVARATGASVWLVHAYVPIAMAPGIGLDAQWMEEQRKTLHELLTDQAQKTGLSAVAGFSPRQVCLGIGSAHRTIVDLAQSVQADLVVIGTAESHGILGSTADRVIRKAPCPVLAVRSETAFPPARVEIPVDLSPISAYALREGLGFLEQIGCPAVDTEVLFVLNPFEVGGSIHFSPEQIQRFAGEELSRFVAGNLPEGTPVRPGSTRVRGGYEREEILATLQERKADLAVLGTHGRGGFERLVIGSVAAGVLRTAGCNLLIVPPAAHLRHEPASAGWSPALDEDPVLAGRS